MFVFWLLDIEPPWVALPAAPFPAVLADPLLWLASLCGRADASPRLALLELLVEGVVLDCELLPDCEVADCEAVPAGALWSELAGEPARPEEGVLPVVDPADAVASWFWRWFVAELPGLF